MNRQCPHIARAALLWKPWKAGDKVVVYKIVATRPEGVVLITGITRLRFDPPRQSLPLRQTPR